MNAMDDLKENRAQRICQKSTGQMPNAEPGQVQSGIMHENAVHQERMDAAAAEADHFEEQKVESQQAFYEEMRRQKRE